MTPRPATLDAWLARQADRERRIVRVEDALLGGRFARYFVYRLRFFALRYAVASVVQLVKVLALHRLLGPTGFIAVVALVAVAGVVAGAWWGALEVLRGRVRLLYRFESPAAVGREIARWMTGATRVGLVLAGAGAAWLVLAAMTRGIQPVDLAIFAVIVRAAIDLPVRAFHAGAFALRRVYRPWISILVLEGIGVALLLLLIPAIGAWSIGVAELVMALAFAAIAVRYAARTHRQLGLAPQRVFSVRRLRPAGAGRARVGSTLRELVAPALAGGVMALDSLVVLAAVGAAGPAHEPWLAVVMAGIAPTIRAGFDWAQLVYFDLRRLDAPLFANLRRRLDRATLVLALVLGAVLAIVGLAAAVGLLGAPAWRAVPLAPFLAGSSVLGLLLMRAFTADAYPRAVVGGAVVAAGLAALRPLADLGWPPLVLLAATVWLGVLLLAMLARWGVGAGTGREPLLPTAWLSRVRSTVGPIRIGAVRVRAAEPKRGNGPLADPGALREWRAIHLARRLAVRAGRAGGATVLEGDRVLWFVREQPRARVTTAIAVAEAGGRVLDVREAVVPSGGAALAALAAWGPAATRSERAAISTVEELERRFRALVPDGVVLDPGRVSRGDVPRLGAMDRRLVLWNAVRHAQRLGTRPEREGPDVTAWCPDGALVRLFLAPAAARRRGVATWRATIRDANLAAASGGAIAGAAAGDAAPPSRATVSASTRGRAPAALAAPAATEFRRG